VGISIQVPPEIEPAKGNIKLPWHLQYSIITSGKGNALQGVIEFPSGGFDFFRLRVYSIANAPWIEFSVDKYTGSDLSREKNP
jgi:hypothetical protein